MAYQTGTANGMADLITKLRTFVSANGWTVNADEIVSNRRLHISKGGAFIQFLWNATPQHLGVFQALAYSGPGFPNSSDNDSGNGYSATSNPTNAQLLTGRCVRDLGNESSMRYHFFEKDSGPAYVHVAVYVGTSGNSWRHFGFGNLDKFSSWTGGEYCYASNHGVTPSAINNDSTYLLDGISNMTASGAVTNEHQATIHIEGMPDQPVASKWAIVFGNDDGVMPAGAVDRNGNAQMRVLGGFRGGPVARSLGSILQGTETARIPLYPINLFYQNHTNLSLIYFIGSMPDVRGVSIKSYADEQEVLIGADTWIMFPTLSRTSTGNSGIAYKKVTA